MSNSKIHICTGRWCSELGSPRIFDIVKAWFTKHDAQTEVVACKCLGYCEQGANAMKNGRVFHELTEENAIEQLTQGQGKERGVYPVDIEDDFLKDL